MRNIPISSDRIVFDYDNVTEKPENYISPISYAMIALIIWVHDNFPIALLFKMPGGSKAWTNIFWIICSIFAIYLAFLKPQKTIKAFIASWPFLILNIWCMASYTWSGEPGNSLKSIIMYSMTVFSGIVLAGYMTWEQFTVSVVNCSGLLMILSPIVSLAIPSIGKGVYDGTVAWDGVFMEKQQLGIHSAIFIIAIVALNLYSDKYRKYLLFLPLGFLNIIGATGKTAFIMLFVSFSTLTLIWFLRRGPIIALITTWTITVVFPTIYYVYKFLGDEIFKLLGRNKTLTGRTEVWEGVQQLIDMRPLFGWGYGAVWTNRTLTSPYNYISDAAGFTPMNAHSSYRDTWLQLGIVGVIILVACILYTLLGAFSRNSKHPLSVMFAISAIMGILSTSFTESILMNPFDFHWLFIVFTGTKLYMENEYKLP